jgi:hypothetical protein
MVNMTPMPRERSDDLATGENLTVDLSQAAAVFPSQARVVIIGGSIVGCIVG